VGEFTLISQAFTHGDEIPRRHTCEGEDVSPALSWSDPPAGTRALALIVDDPDAPVGTFTHWLAWNIEPGAGGLGEGESAPAEGRKRLRDGRLERPMPAARPRPTPLLLPPARARRSARRRLPCRAT
jgi:Raf kinase inhibitor-like YbhB/YbcL family protein